jgi:hypothetical protein
MINRQIPADGPHNPTLAANHPAGRSPASESKSRVVFAGLRPLPTAPHWAARCANFATIALCAGVAGRVLFVVAAALLR